MEKIPLSLSKLERKSPSWAASRKTVMEFHIRRDVRELYALEQALFSLRGNVVLIDLRQVRELTAKFNARLLPGVKPLKAGQLYAMGLIDEILHYVAALYREQIQSDAFETALERLGTNLGTGKTGVLMKAFCSQFPPRQVYAGKTTEDVYLESQEEGESCRALALEELMLLALANMNPAFKAFTFLFDDADLEKKTVYNAAIEELRAHLAALPAFGPFGQNLWDMLRAPALASPDSLAGQLEYMRKNWGLLIGKFMARLLTSLDIMKEEEKPSFFGPGPSEAYTYGALDNEYERFSPDQEWMPRTVLMAKSTLVWLFQLSQKYGREIARLDQIPDEELDELARRGFTGLWLIGLWERSSASKTIKQWTGNPEAAASAYSLYDYDIAGELGGWGALAGLRDRCFRRGIRLGSDMVPNHTGIDSRWIVEHPDRFLQLPYPPFPTYNYNCGNLSGRDDITVQIEEHYFTRNDAAVVFKRIDNRTGEARYIYHGNDGTSMPWNDTAQIDFLNPEAREAVIATIVGVCKQFSIVRFDAAMTLAKRHIQRLWYPEPGRGGDIASRAEHAITTDEFNRRIPNEFWREVVDRCAAEAPHTLLLAEAFWMMEGYFVRTLGMHRVYNSAFMNMLKNEDNAKYRTTIKNTIEFDPEILKRFVNFMNNPDEETAVAQFGKGDKYFGICTLMVTMPGLPMFGHGQIEGFEEKYGMEYRRSYRDEKPDGHLVDRHEREIFPLMKRRNVFSGSAAFKLYDFHTPEGYVNENVFAYSNRDGDDRALILYNNAYNQTSGWINGSSVAIPRKEGGVSQESLAQALSLHGADKYFTLLREHRSALWYIRSSKEIHERGLFAALNGYEAQVFMDIHEVEDTMESWYRWARLHHELNGRGVRDLEAAMEDLLLGELYSPFMEMFKAEKTLEDLKETALTFIRAAKKYLHGADGAYKPFDSPWEHEALEPEQILEEFSAYLERLALLKSYLLGKAAPDKPGKQVQVFLKAAGEQFQANSAEGDAFTLGYGILAMLRQVIGKEAGGDEAAALAIHLGLDRKFRDACAGLGISCARAYRAAALIKAVLKRTYPEDIGPYKTFAVKGAGPQAAAFIVENYNSEDFRDILGVNLFDDAAWFNKEAFEEALFYIPLFLIPESPAAFREIKGRSKNESGRAAGETKARSEKLSAAEPSTKAAPLPEASSCCLETIAALAEQLRLAKERSGYRLDRLIEALAGESLSKTGKADEAKAKPIKAQPPMAVVTAPQKVETVTPVKTLPQKTEPAKPGKSQLQEAVAATSAKTTPTKAETIKPAKTTTAKIETVKPKVEANKTSEIKAVAAKPIKTQPKKSETAKPAKTTPKKAEPTKPGKTLPTKTVATKPKAGASKTSGAKTTAVKPAKTTPTKTAAEKPVKTGKTPPKARPKR